ncbi:hypothetical protein R3P38DRAFT_3230338 [Favolaschia claudopus]|uniref:Uncharacterized protein n=1 Tax=Favolaschia claudopus TaxID=2862362 RepID=A0AAV9ZMM2_9AGAR
MSDLASFRADLLAGPYYLENEDVISDFQFAMRTITKLMAQVETDGYKKSGIFNFNENPKIGFKIRHIVFEPKEESIIELFVLQDWPVKNAAVKEALEGMENSHQVIPIRAYDVDGDLISPAHYMSKLSGAVVRATLTLSHWKIGRDKRDTYTADIESLRVLVPASVAGSFEPAQTKSSADCQEGSRYQSQP